MIILKKNCRHSWVATCWISNRGMWALTSFLEYENDIHAFTKIFQYYIYLSTDPSPKLYLKPKILVTFSQATAILLYISPTPYTLLRISAVQKPQRNTNPLKPFFFFLSTYVMEGFLRSWKHSSVQGELGLFCKPKPREAMMVTKPKSQEDDENEVSTELTLSCGFQTNVVKSCNPSSREAMEPTYSQQNYPLKVKNEVSTELTLSCVGSQSQTNYDNKRKESKSTSSFMFASTTNNEFLSKNPEEEEEVSTALTLFDESWYRNSLKRKNMENFASNSKMKQEERTVLSVSDQNDPTNNEFLTENPEEEEEEEVSTELTLFDESWYRNSLKRKNLENFASTSKTKQEERTVLSVSDQKDPWEIKKILQGSDIGHMSCLLVHTHLVKYNILPYFDTEWVRKIETKGVKFTVWDEDTRTRHQLVLMQWPRSKRYIFKTMWRRDFVKRRGLKTGDEIGFYWDSQNSMFHFSVLKRAGV
jgi:hypothetical protein